MVDEAEGLPRDGRESVSLDLGLDIGNGVRR